MATYNLSIRYAGDAINDGRIPVKDLAPSLLALSDSFQEIQKIIDPESEPVSLDIKATEKGSFLVDLVLANGKDIVSNVISFLTSNPTTAIINLSALVTTFYGVFKLTKSFYNKKIERKESLSNGDVRITLNDGTTIATNEKILKSYQNLDVRTSIHDIVQPLERKGLNSLEISSEKEVKITVDKKDYEKFKVPKPNDKELDDKTTTEYLQIESVAFEHGKWKFFDGTNKFFAEIKDEEFIDKVSKNQTQFGSTDILKVELRKKTFQTTDGLKNEYTIEKVLEHKKGPQEIELDFDN